ncbi:hypothetical protein HRI_005154300 [Hibiscus trionum]|uniref:Uncharacterized protein n=1 Tax=Hibiscus trionum TaxID=183268 RepID=A0A9W7JHY1_HIBTR|nr:hypothetical protein HRI_005154300 [Hibiscus trionum]
MHTGSLYVSQKSIGIKQHDDFFPRRSSRVVSIINLSSEDCDDGATAAVPFNWESEPGTPKVKCRKIPRLPPLTPPPSYFYSTPKTTVKDHSKPKLLGSILPKRLRRKPRVQHSPASYSSSSSASSSRSSSPWPRSYSVPSSPIGASNLYAGDELPRAKLFSGSRANKEDQEYEYSASTGCFGGGARAVSRGFCSTMLKALLIEK